MLLLIFDVFGNKSFLFYQVQAFPQYVMLKSYAAEELEFKKRVQCVTIADVLYYANVVSSKTVYEIKTIDDGTLKQMARIVPHDNVDSYKHLIKSDCAMCSHVGI